MDQSTNINSQYLSPDLKVRLDERLQIGSVGQESVGSSSYCHAARAALLDLIEARWSQISPPSAAEVESWIAVGRRGEK